jgi:hypothetical protein
MGRDLSEAYAGLQVDVLCRTWGAQSPALAGPGKALGYGLSHTLVSAITSLRLQGTFLHLLTSENTKKTSCTPGSLASSFNPFPSTDPA